MRCAKFLSHCTSHAYKICLKCPNSKHLFNLFYPEQLSENSGKEFWIINKYYFHKLTS